MRFLVVGHVVHKYQNGSYYAYGPYVREMNLWFKYVDKVIIVAPLNKEIDPDPIDLPYEHDQVMFFPVPEFSTQSVKNIFSTLFHLPGIFWTVITAMRSADHIHLRCPGNMGLIGALAQFFFRNKNKTAKYAGNWDRSSDQPYSYRLQQKIISSPFLAPKMRVLVYGEWPNETENIVPFFTATYSERDIIPLSNKEINLKKEINLIYVGGLYDGKQPLISAKVLLQLIKKGYAVKLDYFGEGPERKSIEEFRDGNGLENSLFLHGNVKADQVKKAFQEAHFLIFISKSEGWPKVVAESMFWGCLPVTTAVSCVPQMLDFGNRGELVNGHVDEIAERVEHLILAPDLYLQKSQKAAVWSRSYTLERFESEIRSLIYPESLAG
ncbi:MAG: Glycosyltransferase [Algoriphagus marincola HL-49]|uniref:Glycosyltransferase n=1 Tax=Algoriphagus marincola HL-49 TaxID=1305737 RepID=A0A0N8KDI6_9BACT|nr:MAG: Glycosyltransferase [Algoriphagus marincola HL-49]